MGRIGPSLSGIELRLVNLIAADDATVAASVLRSSTGHRINSSSDDPSAFMALAGLQSQLARVTAATTNVAAAGSLVTQTRSAMDEMTYQLASVIREELLKDASGGLTPAQRAESQAKIDTAIDRINAIVGSSIDGRRPLDGSSDFIVTGRNASQVAELSVRSTGGTSRTVSGSVLSTATQAALVYAGDADNKVKAPDSGTITLTGLRGTEQFTVTGGQTLASLAETINQSSYATGVTAAVNATAHTLTFTSVDYGSTAKTAVSSTGTFVVTGGDGQGTAYGTNASARINGATITSTDARVQGNRFSIADNGFSYEVEFTAGFTGAFETMTASGNALTFALDSDLAHRTTLAIPGMQSYRLGGASGKLSDLASGGSLSGLGANTAQAIRVVDEALGDLTRGRGRVDGFYNSAVVSASDLLDDLHTNLQDAIDGIDKTDDEAEETIQSYYSGLASNAAAGLAILRQQRESIIDLIRQAARLTS